jgi:hypothetical protein
VLSNAGKKIMDHARAVIFLMLAEEVQLYKERRQLYAQESCGWKVVAEASKGRSGGKSRATAAGRVDYRLQHT